MRRYREADSCVFGDGIGLPKSRVQALPGYRISWPRPLVVVNPVSSAEIEMNVGNPLDVVQMKCALKQPQPPAV